MMEQPIPFLVISPPQKDAIDRMMRQKVWRRYWEPLITILGLRAVRRISAGGPWFRTEIGGVDVGGVWELPFGAEREEQRLR